MIAYYRMSFDQHTTVIAYWMRTKTDQAKFNDVSSMSPLSALTSMSILRPLIILSYSNELAVTLSKVRMQDDIYPKDWLVVRRSGVLRGFTHKIC